MLTSRNDQIPSEIGISQYLMANYACINSKM